jgi:DNA-binding Lrp family transcriptional regulator
VSPLQVVRQRAAEVQKRESELEQARRALREAVRYAHAEGIPITRIAREAGLSRQWVSQLVRDA